ncbi:MAG: retron St85 family effector protein [Proteobacteria bacterium]|nr:retron St85 family effector protein [Pseudomonadota bacterium]
MQIVKSNSAFDLPREKLGNYFSRGKLFLSNKTHLSFVCGAANATLQSTNEPSLRALFIEHVRVNNADRLLCVRAESATTELLLQLEERERTNLAYFEKLIAETVDSVLVFPESPGSFAELGFFSAHEAISKKTLVAIHSEYQDNSFISLGPIHYISAISKYRPLPIAVGDDTAYAFRQITTRLIGESDAPLPKRRRFDKQDWKKLDTRVQLAILDEMVEIVGAITEPDLLQLITDTFDAYDVSLVRMLVSLLVAMDRVATNENGDIFALNNGVAFMDSDDDERISLISRWRNAYEKHQPEALEELARRSMK